MDVVRSHLSNIVKECDAAEKTWSDHMKQPDYCLDKNFMLYKRYMRLFNHLQELNMVLSNMKKKKNEIKHWHRRFFGGSRLDVFCLYQGVLVDRQRASV